MCLSGYELSDRESGKSVALAGAKISPHTFLKSGMPAGFSSICTYDREGKRYVYAFSSKTAMAIDVQRNQVRMIRNLQDDGWVNCVCPVEEQGRTTFYLGCEGNCIVQFDPEQPDHLAKCRRITTACAVDSLVCVTWCGQRYLVFSGPSPGVYYVPLATFGDAPTASCALTPEPQRATQEQEMYEEDVPLSCRLAYRQADNTVLAAYGSRLFVLDGNSGEIALAELRMQWRGLRPHRIWDICVTRSYIFLNERGRISAISLPDLRKRWEFIIDKSTALAQRRQELSRPGESPGDPDKIDRIIAYENAIAQGYGGEEKRFYFTRLSAIPATCYPGEEGVLVGVKTNRQNVYDKIPNFFELLLPNPKQLGDQGACITEVRTEQRLATYTGVYYRLPDGSPTVYAATTSDDRAVDLVALHNDEIAPVHFSGAYNGVRKLRFLDDGTILCAQYDGSVLMLGSEEEPDAYADLDDLDVPGEPPAEPARKWKVKRAVRVHHDWVWNAVPFGHRQGTGRQVVSCSFDHTVRLTDLQAREQLPPLLHTDQMMQDVMTFDAGGATDVWAISRDYLYHVRCIHGQWQDPERFGQAGYQMIALVDLGNNLPYVVYRIVEQEEVQIGYYSSGQLIPVIRCGHIYFRKAFPVVYQGVRYLWVARRRSLLLYRETADHRYVEHGAWRYVTNRTINDILFFEMDAEPVLLIADKGNQLYWLTIDPTLLSITSCHTYLTESQPLCFAKRGDQILLGLLNGKIKRLERTAQGLEMTDLAVTQADLYADQSVDLQDCQIVHREAFLEQLGSYFIL